MYMKEKKIIYNILKTLCIPLIKIVYSPKVYGKQNIPVNASLIFAGNHKHAFDPVIVAINSNRFIHFMAKEEVSSGIFKPIFDLVGIIRVYKNKSKNIQSVLHAENLLKSGGTLGIFPEGTRNRTDKTLLRFKTGTVKMAKETNTKIVPFAIRGTYKPFRKSIELEFGKPIDVSKMELTHANDFLKNEILKLLTKD